MHLQLKLLLPAAPAPAAQAPAPVAGQSPVAPAPAGQAPAPVAGQSPVAPAPAGQAPAPVAGQAPVAPAPAGQAPAQSAQFTAPVEGQDPAAQFLAPTEQAPVAPAPAGQAPAPVAGQAPVAPAPAGQAPAPVAGQAPVAPAPAGQAPALAADTLPAQELQQPSQPTNFDERSFSLDENQSIDGSEIIATQDPLAEEIEGAEGAVLPRDPVPINAVTGSEAKEKALEIQKITALQERESAIKRDRMALVEKISVERDLDKLNQYLKSEAILASREIALLEEKILFPYKTDVGIFFSVKSLPSDHRIDSVSLYVDGRLVQTHLYSAVESSSLLEGAIQKLYTGSLISGDHTIELLVRTQEEEETIEEQSVEYTFEKELGSKFIQLELDDDAITSREW